MKRKLCCFFLMTMVLGVTGCGGQNSGQNDQQTQQAQQEATTQDTTTPSPTATLPAAETAANETAAATETPAGTSSGITEEDAKQIALDHAGVTEADVSNLRVKKGIDDGTEEYEVNFYANGQEYDYDIDAVSGTIRSMDMEAAPTGGATSLTEEDAAAIVLEKLPGASRDNIRMKQDEDDGRMVYEGNVILDGRQYEFEIDAASGTILSWEEDD